MVPFQAELHFRVSDEVEGITPETTGELELEDMDEDAYPLDQFDFSTTDLLTKVAVQNFAKSWTQICDASEEQKDGFKLPQPR